MLEPASEIAARLQGQIYASLAMGGAIFLIVGTLLVIALVRFRQGRRNAGPISAAHHEERKELTWMVGPILITLWLGFVTAKLTLAITADAPAASGDPHIEVVGKQWFWEFRYPGHDIVTANELVIPKGERLLVKVTANDVIHSFWAPKLSGKIDAIPGRDNWLYFGADEVGTYQGLCSEFCGAQHAWMRFVVRVVEPQEYQEWLSAQSGPAPAVPADGVPGEELFSERTCTLCHVVERGIMDERVGPNLAIFADRTVFAGGKLDVSRDNLVAWLRDPQTLKPSCRMPDFVSLTDEEIEQLADFLMSRT